jgi:hypothetical protein
MPTRIVIPTTTAVARAIRRNDAGTERSASSSGWYVRHTSTVDSTTSTTDTTKCRPTM